jgi:hypothetical protein
VPETVGELRDLRLLDLRANPLCALPDALADLPALQKLDLRWTPFFPKLPPVARHLRDRGCTVWH